MSSTGAVEAPTPSARRVLAPNPGPMTLEGTNTWLLAGPEAKQALVVDPGPDEEGHLRRVANAAGEVAAILFTHRHPDHADGTSALQRLTGAPVLGPFADGELVRIAGLEIRVLVTPGHSADSICLLVESDGALLTGDTVLGRGTTVIAHPDGRLGDYLASLRRLQREPGVRLILPGHGPVVRDPGRLLADYLAHREERLEHVRAALTRGATTVEAVVELVYADVDRSLWPAAAMSVRAQLDYLRERGGG